MPPTRPRPRHLLAVALPHAADKTRVRAPRGPTLMSRHPLQLLRLLQFIRGGRQEAELLQTSRPESLDDEVDAQRKLPQRDRECEEPRQRGAILVGAEQRGEGGSEEQGLSLIHI